MIEKIHRFQGRGSLRFVYQRGQTVRGQFSSLKYIVNKRRTTYRLAVVVSRKVSKSAVVRNRIRRRIYEAVRQLPIADKPPYDLVITVYSENLAEIEWPELEQAVVSQLQKACILPAEHQALTPGHGIVDTKERE